MTVYVVMGVSGCGKSTVGMALAERWGCPYYEGDAFHPPENVTKMANGFPLDDDDRAPWLARLRTVIADHVARGETAVVACSALKKSYRAQLQVNGATRFIYLHGHYDLIWQRMQARHNHYMKVSLLRSQFETLEPPNKEEALIIDIDRDIEAILKLIAANI